MKGIILAGGKGTRLYPLTLVTHKELLPIYDQPMIYYSLQTLINIGIKEILIITTNEYLEKYRLILNTYKKEDITIKYVCEKESKGSAQSIILAKDFIKDDNVCLIYGDNIFLGNLEKEITKAYDNLKEDKSSIFIYKIKKKETKKFGVVNLSKNNKIVSLEEKPLKSTSRYITTGLYFYTNEVINLVDKIKLSPRNELEITDINKLYLKDNKLEAIKINKKVKWIDAGNVENLFKANMLVRKTKK